MQQDVVSFSTVKLIHCTAQIGKLLTAVVYSKRKKYFTRPKNLIPENSDDKLKTYEKHMKNI
jgi:hypothetical protein